MLPKRFELLRRTLLTATTMATMLAFLVNQSINGIFVINIFKIETNYKVFNKNYDIILKILCQFQLCNFKWFIQIAIEFGAIKIAVV